MTAAQNKGRNLLVTAFVIAFVACCLVSLLAAAFSKSNSTPAAPTLQPKSSLTFSAPTARPSPQSTSTQTATSTPANTPTPQPTSTFTPAPGTLTAIAKLAAQQANAATASELASYAEISIKELVTYPDQHTGEKVKVRGQIFNINNTTELQIWVGGSYDAIYVLFIEPFSGIYKNDYITVYGVVQGSNCGTNAYGAKVCQPLIIGTFYVRK